MVAFADQQLQATIGFNESYLTSSATDNALWNDQGPRMSRYGILWAMYEQTAYREVHTWAKAMRKKYALYKYVRPVYNPAHRAGVFWQNHIFGGVLDAEAGESGAIPIATENELLRAAIAELWLWSRWRVQKDILTVRGTILGDAAIRVKDDVVRGRVYLELLYPGYLYSVERDPQGNVKGYVIRKRVSHPVNQLGTVTYGEVVSRDGDKVVYETFLDGAPYAWPENLDVTGTPAAVWEEPYGFVPLVLIQHNDVGLKWGWGELHAVRAKVHEIDDLASMITDQVRKTVNPIWLMKKVQAPTSKVLTIEGARRSDDLDRRAPGREETSTLWNAPADSSAEAVVAEIDFEGVLQHLAGLQVEIERDLVELSPDIHTASGDASGRALRVARQPVVSKVIQRRANYDSGMVAAQQMAVAIGGMRGYEGYTGFSLDSYERGDLDHSIIDRSVFEEDPLDKTEIDNAFWMAASVAVRVGVPIESYLKEAGWTDERIAELKIQEQERESADGENDTDTG